MYNTTLLSKVAVHTFLFAALAAAPALIGCSANADDPSADGLAADSADLSSTAWQSTLTCGGHGLTLDVDRAERRHLQAVIRDPGAVAYLASHHAGSSGMPNAKGEIVIDGFVTQGVFTPSDFHGFDHSTFSGEDALLPDAHVDRDGDGVRVRLVTWASGHEVETSNWFFPSCH
jgi:hypothetical protein